MLPKVLGKIFYKSHKKPIPVNLEPYKQKDASGKRVKSKSSSADSKSIAPPLQVAKEIEKTIDCALVHLSPSNNVAIRIGLSSFTPQQIADNVKAVVAGLVEKFIPKGWRNIKSVHIKGPNTMALPIWLADELWVEKEDVLEEEEMKAIEEAKQEKATARIESKRQRRALNAEARDEGKGSKRPRIEEGGTEERKKKKSKVEDADLSKEMRERRERLRGQKRLDREQMQVKRTAELEA
ncbi:MAG: hypothetical protein Q9183_003557 [Haloplaca sp. 2 TL-2023]